MLRLKWKEILEVVGIFAVVASLLFVGQQIRLDRQFAKEESSHLSAENQIALSQLIADHADVWIKGLIGEDLSPSDRIRFNQIAYAVEMKYISLYGRSVSGIRTGGVNNVALNFAHHLHTYPGLRQTVLGKWDRMNKAFNREFRFHSLVIQYLEQIDKGEIEPVPKDFHAL